MNRIALFLSLLLLACNGNDRPPKPDNLISENKMSDILYDVFVLNSAKGMNKKLLENNGIFPQDYVYKKHNIDSLQFAKSNEYYAYDVKTYEAIIDKVKQRIEKEKEIYDAIVLKEQKTKDSINETKSKAKLQDTIQKDSILKPKDSLRLLKKVLKQK